tara:strand:+ start:1116 stop:1241 length:126 start_codon:yes stop_codon:yes gene_type:complete
MGAEKVRNKAGAISFSAFTLNCLQTLEYLLEGFDRNPLLEK